MLSKQTVKKLNVDAHKGSDELKSSKRKISSLCEDEKAQIDQTRKSGDANNSDDVPMSPSRSPSRISPKSSLAKRAAGWGIEDGHEDMSSVLIGMGIASKHNITVG